MNPEAKGLKVCSFNTRSLQKHMEDVRSDPVLMQSHINCLQETWLKVGEEEDKGLFTYYVSRERGVQQMLTKADEGGRGVSQLLTKADKGGRG